MRLAIGSDEQSSVAEEVAQLLAQRGMDVELHGALKQSDATQWAGVALRVAKQVASGHCDQGLLFCWTGTGVSIAANKIPGVRAALCVDAETARGARRYNDANVLCLSLRLTSAPIAHEILDAWFATTEVDDEERGSIELVMQADRRREAERAGRGKGAHAGQRA
jgi:ribose 5-phosphate isomerase B